MRPVYETRLAEPEPDQDRQRRAMVDHPDEGQAGRFTQKISETTVVSPDWAREHWKTICHAYARAPHFRDYAEQLEELYLGCAETHLSRINYRMLSALCGILGIGTPLSWADDYDMADGKNERLISICKQAGAVEYLSGAAAQSYIDVAQFASEGITVRWMDYDSYPEYPQLFPPFTHFVSVIDLLFNTGADAPKYMKWAAS